MSKKILQHPDKEEIIEKLIGGDSVKEVEAWIKDKYPGLKSNHISYMTLQKFRSEHLNLKGDVLDDIKNRKKEVEKQMMEEEAQEVIRASSAYQDKINEIADEKLDVARNILKLEKIISSRMEFYFNSLQNGYSIKEDKVFLEYLNAFRGLLQDWKKLVEGQADKKIDHNININVVNEQAKIMKLVIFEVLQEMDPSASMIFIEKLNSKMKLLEHNNEDYYNYLTVDV